MRCTTEDVRQALAEFYQTPDAEDAVTVSELMESMGTDSEYYRRKYCSALRRMVKAGSIEMVRVPRTCIDGRTMMVPGYRRKG